MGGKLLGNTTIVNYGLNITDSCMNTYNTPYVLVQHCIKRLSYWSNIFIQLELASEAVGLHSSQLTVKERPHRPLPI